MPNIVDDLRLLESGARWADSAAADVLERAADEIERLLVERDELQESIKLLDELWHGYHDSYVSQLEKCDRMKDVLHRISLGSQNSGTTKEDLGREARAALKEAGHE
jgi:Ni,Fe-hydrogenase III large subunit